MAGRIEIKGHAIYGLLLDEGVATETEKVARRIDAAASQSSDTKLDVQHGPHRFRVAVIAGYEHGATAQNSRAVLLRALDGA